VAAVAAGIASALLLLEIAMRVAAAWKGGGSRGDPPSSASVFSASSARKSAPLQPVARPLRVGGRRRALGRCPNTARRIDPNHEHGLKRESN
jgi:hypothetical protein